MRPSSGRRSKIKRKSIMDSKGRWGSFCGDSNLVTCVALLGICVACLPLLVTSSQLDEGLVVDSGSGPMIDSESEDLIAAESQNIGLPPQSIPLPPPNGLPRFAAVPTSPIPVAVPPPPPNSPVNAFGLASSPPAGGFALPKSDLLPAPSYAPRYVVPPVSPWGDRLPFEVASFRRRAAAEDDPVEDDYQPSESKGKKSSPSFFKRIRNGIRNTGKAIVGAPSYIIKRYRKTYFGSSGGGKKKKGGWKGWSSSPKQDGGSTGSGWGGDGWEEYEPSGFDREPAHYPYEKGWSKGKGGFKDFDSHERRYDREGSSYRDYRDRDRERDRGDSRDTRDDRDRPRERPRSRDRPQKYSQSYREETQYDDYDGRRTTAYYGPPDRKSPPERTSERPSERPSEKKRSPPTSRSDVGGSYKYDDDY